MTLVRLAVWASLLATIGAAALSGLALRKPRLEAWTSKAMGAAWGLVSLPLSLLLVEFLLGRLDLFYVWANVDQAYPWWLRIAGLWGGQEGTFLLWAWFVLGATLVEDTRSSSPSWPVARLATCITGALLLVPPVVLGTGWETATFGLTGDGSLVRGAQGPSPLSLRPEGAGLNPLLETVYMAIHPAVMFLAYGLSAIPFAYGFSRLATGKAGWREPARSWARWAWLAFLAGLTLGALWAYHVLSFGGYWIWDPVEVANLIPFLALTLFLHALPAQRGGGFGLLAPAMAVLAFVMVVFTDFVVRSGLWSSVHAFLPTGVTVTMEDPVRRLAVTAKETFQARYAVSLLAVAVGTVSGSACAFLARDRGRGSLARRVAVGGAIAYGLVGVTGLLAPQALIEFVQGVLSRVSLGRPLLGVGALVLIAALPFVVGLFWMPEERELGLGSRAGQLAWACTALGVTFAGTVLLLVIGVNGYQESVYTARAPYIAGAVLGLVAVAFPVGRIRRWGAVVVGGLALGVVVKLVSGSWAWAAVSVAGVALAGAGSRFVRLARPTATGPSRWQAGLLLVGGLLGVVHWASPGVVSLPGMAVASPGWFVPVGLLAGAVAIVSPFLERRGAPSWLGPLACVASVGYGVSVVAGVLAWAWAPSRATPRGSLHRAGVPLVHVGLAVVVLGVAVSTYGSTMVAFDREDPLVRGEEARFGSASFELVDGNVVWEEGEIARVEATVHVREGGSFVAEERLTLTMHEGTGVARQGSFVPEESPVVRSWWGDYALNADTGTPLSVRLSDENGTWVTANGPRVDANTTDVEAVSMGVERLPLVNLVWAGSVVLGLGMVSRVWGVNRPG